MQVFESLDIAEQFANPILTIGNYDGLHVGHKKIIDRVREKALAINGTAVLMTFDPHPLRVIRPDKVVGMITPVYLKKKLIEEAGIDVLFVLPFNDEFRLITPEEFVRRILVETLAIKGLIVGYDFKFGRQGKGTIDDLRTLSGRYGYSFEVQSPITLDGEKVGSNRIRKMIAEGEVEKAGRHLGRSYMIEGLVVPGEARGRSIGFPTVNLQTEFELVPKRGVYITSVRIDGVERPAVTNIGYNPTFDGTRRTIETHILDFSGDLYGKGAALYFLQRVRDEVKFRSVDELKTRIGADVRMARDYFRRGRVTGQKTVD